MIPVSSTAQQRPPLRRARSNSAEMPTPLIAGVCSGLAVHLGLSVKKTRLAIILMSGFFGAGIFLYLWLIFTVPLDDLGSSQPVNTPVKRLRNPLARVGRDMKAQAVSGQLLIAGTALIIVAAIMVVGVAFFRWTMLSMLSVIAFLGGVALIWMQVPNLAEWRSPKVSLRALSGVILVLIGIILFVSRTAEYSEGQLGYGVGLGVLLVVAVVAALAPLWFGMANSMASARSNEARETERADIAAHLHDSVLQTLTLIRASADDPMRVRALALTQERELRAWLYTGHEDPGQSVAKILEDRVSGIETVTGIEIPVVAVGDLVPGPAELAAVAAAGEATNNAVRHGAPPVSVYMEVSPENLEIFVKDSGEGFDLEQIPDDRHGVKDSILGRVERVGGKATIRTQGEGLPGTEVHIQVPCTGPHPTEER